MTRITGTAYEYQHKFFIIPRSFLVRLRNASNESCRANQNTHFMFNNALLHPHPPKYGAVYTVENYITDGHATDKNMAHAHFTLGT
jgi:hypothetical protein